MDSKLEQILIRAKQRLGFTELNAMQQDVVARMPQMREHDMVICSPTGSGKTVAFGIPLARCLGQEHAGVTQAVVIAPTRELVIQTTEVIRALATGYKVTSLYGGHNARDERLSLTITPSVIVATPGRLLDHVINHRVDLSQVAVMVLDEFDKCLELGFEQEIRGLLEQIPKTALRLLTSATPFSTMPAYIHLRQPLTLNYTEQIAPPCERMEIVGIPTDEQEKLHVLQHLLLATCDGPTIVFTTHRMDTVRVANYLGRNKISATAFHGTLGQADREKALAMFRNHSVLVLVATDLASRGLDINGVSNIIHCDLPVSRQAYIHRNGRTARVNSTGKIFLLADPHISLPDYITVNKWEDLPEPLFHQLVAPMATLHIMGGRKDKISRGDILGFMVHHGGVEAGEIGLIEVKDHYSFVAVPRALAHDMVKRLSSYRLKGRHIRISVAR